MIVFKPYMFNPLLVWYSYHAILSYNQDINVLIGDRGCGKTYGAEKIVYADFKFLKRKFAIIRDTESAVETMCEGEGENMFSAIKKDPKFKNDTFELKGNRIYMNGQHAGYIMAVSTFYNRKGNDYADVFNVIYDEFIPEKDQVRIGDDVRKFINTIQNITRTRKCRLFLLANALDKGNGILELLGFDSIKDYGFYINKEKHAILHYIAPNDNYKRKKQQSLTGFLVSGSRYEENLVENKFVGGDDFIFDKLPPRDIIGIYHNKNGVAIRLFEGKKGNEYFATKDINANTLLYMRYTFDINNVNPRCKLAPKEHKKFLQDIYAQHLLKFESKYIKNQFLDLL